MENYLIESLTRKAYHGVKLNKERLYMTEKKRKPDTDHKKEWDKKYMYFVGFKLFRAHGSGKDDQEVIDFLEEQAAKE